MIEDMKRIVVNGNRIIVKSITFSSYKIKIFHNLVMELKSGKTIYIRYYSRFEKKYN